MCGEKLGVGAARIGCGGITPAYAGKRSSVCPASPKTRDHPRVCGEKPFPQLESTVPPGSPPRMRGKVPSISRPAPASGITPACAGKSCPPQAPTFTRQDHPRVCGEKPIFPSGAASTVGSPPRVWGKEENLAEDTLPTGITPAYAGKRPPAARWNSLAEDHPRVCGEKGLSMFWSLNHSGSPLRVRGKAFGLLCC